MKWILYIFGAIAGVLVLGVVILLLMGMRQDATVNGASITLRESPDRIWPWLYEPDKLKVWVSWLTDVQRESGPPQIGQTAVWTMKDMNNGGMLMKIKSTPVTVNPSRTLTVRLEAPEGFTGNVNYELQDLGNGRTLLHVTSRYDFDFWLAKLMKPLIMSEARKKLAADLGHLREAIEKEK